MLEIGAGMGALTRQIALHGGHLTAVELDDRLVERLRIDFRGNSHVKILHANALDLNPCDFASETTQPDRKGRFKLAGNIPYYITGSLMRHYLDTPCRPALSVLMIQYEVAQRILARPGDMSMLALSTQLYTEPSLVTRVSPASFRPRPKVESAVIKLISLPEPRVSIPYPEAFFSVARSGFSMRRKQLINSLSHGLRIDKEILRGELSKVGVLPAQRAEDLNLDQWSSLTLGLIQEQILEKR